MFFVGLLVGDFLSGPYYEYRIKKIPLNYRYWLLLIISAIIAYYRFKYKIINGYVIGLSSGIIYTEFLVLKNYLRISFMEKK